MLLPCVRSGCLYDGVDLHLEDCRTFTKRSLVAVLDVPISDIVTPANHLPNDAGGTSNDVTFVSQLICHVILANLDF